MAKTSVRWRQNDESKWNQIDPKTHPAPPDLFMPPQPPSISTLLGPWVNRNIDDRKHQSTNSDKDPTFAHPMTVDDADGQKGENGRIFLIFFDGHPKPQFRIHYLHWLMRRIPNESSERIKRKDGETMTKIEKGNARLSPVDTHSQVADPDSFLYQYSVKSYPRTTDTCVISIRL